MRDLGELWKKCQNGEIETGEWQYERRVFINDGTPYTDELIMDVQYERGLLYNTYTIGNCISSKILLTVLPQANSSVRNGDTLRLEVRINTLYDGVTDWHEFGHYSVTKSEEKGTKWSIEGYDAISKLDVNLSQSVYGTPSWPVNPGYLVNAIANYLGITVDSRTVYDNNIQIKKPENISMRDALTYIAELHGGNWYITETNKLRMVVPKTTMLRTFSTLSTEIYVPEINKSNSKSIIREEPLVIDKVAFRYGDAPNDKYEAGNGKNELELVNPWSSQYAANKVNGLLKNVVYNPFEIKSTEIDPAVELGDQINIEGRSETLWQANYSKRLYANIKLPNETPSKGNYYDRGLRNNGTDYSYKFNEYDLKMQQYELSMRDYDMRMSDYEYKLRSFNDRLLALENSGGGGGTGDYTPETDFVYDQNNSGNALRWRYIGDSDTVSIPPTLGGEVVSNIDYMFENTSVSVVKSNSNINSAVSTFNSSTATLLNMSGLDLSGVVSMETIFKNSSMSEIIGLETMINNSTGKQPGEISLKEAFHGAKLTNIDISNWKLDAIVAKGLNIAGIFRDMPNLDLVKLSNLPLHKLSWYEGHMFMYAKRGISVDVSNMYTSETTDISYLFGHCLSIGNIYGLDTWDTSNVEKMDNFITDSTINNGPGEGISSIDISMWDMSKLISANRAFDSLSVDSNIETHINLSSIDFTKQGFEFDNIFSPGASGHYGNRVAYVTLRSVDDIMPLKEATFSTDKEPDIYGTIHYQDNEEHTHFIVNGEIIPPTDPEDPTDPEEPGEPSVPSNLPEGAVFISGDEMAHQYSYEKVLDENHSTNELFVNFSDNTVMIDINGTSSILVVAGRTSFIYYGEARLSAEGESVAKDIAIEFLDLYNLP